MNVKKSINEGKRPYVRPVALSVSVKYNICAESVAGQNQDANYSGSDTWELDVTK